MRILVIALSLISFHSWADCYVVGDLEGYSTRQAKQFGISTDSLGDQIFIIEIDGENSSVKPDSLQCSQMGTTVLVCVNQKSGGKLWLETWAVHPEDGKVVYTKANHSHDVFDGANLMVGNIKGSCN